jgi:hypothetical protein
MMSRLHSVSIHGWRALALACLAAVFLTGCPVEEPGGVDAGPVDTFTMVYEAIGEKCAGCHAPGAPGSGPGVEATQDWSSRDSALNSLQGMSTGLVGNFADCNGVPFIGPTPESSLILAAIDPDVKADFSVSNCNTDTLSDMNLKLAADPLSAQDVALVREWLMEETAGSP